MASETLQKVTSPKGPLAWVIITGEGKENMSGKMQYKADVILDPNNIPAHKEWLNQVDEFWKENRPNGFEKRKPKSLGYYLCDPVYDEDGIQLVDEETGKKVYDPKGKVAVSFKTDVAWPDGKPKKIPTRNYKGNEVQLGDQAIGNGSEGYIAGAMDMYYAKAGTKITDAGVTFYLNEIKLIKFVAYKKENPFEDTEEDEGGWTGDDIDPFEGTDEDAPRPKL